MAMANFNVKEERWLKHQPKNTPPCTAMWNMNNKGDAEDQIKYRIERAKKYREDKVRIYLNGKLRYTQNVPVS